MCPFLGHFRQSPCSLLLCHSAGLLSNHLVRLVASNCIGSSRLSAVWDTWNVLWLFLSVTVLLWWLIRSCIWSMMWYRFSCLILLAARMSTVLCLSFSCVYADCCLLVSPWRLNLCWVSSSMLALTGMRRNSLLYSGTVLVPWSNLFLFVSGCSLGIRISKLYYECLVLSLVIVLCFISIFFHICGDPFSSSFP